MMNASRLNVVLFFAIGFRFAREVILRRNVIPLAAFSVLFVFSVLPAEETPLDESNSWALDVPQDNFTSDALLDLRSLNEPQSGETGFIRLSDDGNGFVRGDGKPVRFWAIGTDVHLHSHDDIDAHCRWLAKLGVNLIRLHVTVCRTEEGATLDDMNQKVIDGCHYMIKAAKANGIYVMISPYYAHYGVPESWGLEGGKQRSVGLLFFNTKLQRAYKTWTTKFYGDVNPHTGLAIKDDPTVAMLQVHNEDSMLFWTTDAIKDVQWKTVSDRFTKWAVAKYGSAQAAWDSWGKGARKAPDDDLTNGKLGCLRIYFLTIDGMNPDDDARLADTSQFLGELQRGFYEMMGRHLRDDVGCKQVLNATNWRTANDSRLKGIERHTYHALDFNAENEYVGSDYQHAGKESAYRIDVGHHLVNESVLSKPFEHCTNWRQEEGHPFIITETAWKNPNRYQSEGPFLVAGYQSLNGIDAVVWFNCLTPHYETDPLRSYWSVDGQLSTHKWNHCYPAMMAGFPANALLYRMNYLQQAEPVVRDIYSMDDLWQRKPNRIEDNEAYGDARNPAELQPGWKAKGDEINQVAFQIGPVVTKRSSDPSEAMQADLAKYFDPEKGTINSATGELIWDYRKEICTMDAPKAQGVTGFLAKGGGTYHLADVLIESQNDYATVNVVSLDQKPIQDSDKVLVQVVTTNRLTGWKTKNASFSGGNGDRAWTVDGEQIVTIGKPPFRVANHQVRVTVKNTRLKQATFLDINGYPTGTTPLNNGTVELPPNAIYTILQP